ncbi:MAG: DUF4342 domain-containing protein [Parvularculaceae bacterium]|nr:DUF4342 domain-containing protein [Parvularculaceae bacterium]
MSDEVKVPQPPEAPEAPAAPKTDGAKTITEQLEVAGNQLVDQVQDLIKQGNVRKLVIKTADDRELIQVSLTVGAVAGVATALAAPWLAALGAIAALVARVKIEIIREEEG